MSEDRDKERRRCGRTNLSAATVDRPLSPPNPRDPSRRTVLAGFAATPFVLSGAARAQLGFTEYPFSLGVAAGDAMPDGFVAWTRLAPRPLEPRGGMPADAVPVDWEVAEDDGFRQVVARGQEVARPELGHSVHAEVVGLRPGRSYWYRFRCAGETSLTGRAQTLPAPDSAVDRVRFAAVGCQHFEAGWYTGYRHVAEERLDFVFHYGDYIYEYSPGFVLDAFQRVIEPVRRYLGPEPYTLDEYRLRYAQETLDADLQAARAAHPWFCTYDDHEVQNDWAGDADRHGTPPELFRLRRAQALQAWYEHMPVRRDQLPVSGLVDCRRRADFGDLLRGHFLDTRLYRTPQPCDDGFKEVCPAVSDPASRMMSAEEERWLADGLRGSRQRWQLVAQQVMVCPVDRTRLKDGPVTLNMDSWAGYRHPRERLLGMLARTPNAVVVTGDEHQNWANDLMHEGRTVASEYVATSMTSGGDGYELRPGNEAIMVRNPAVRWTNDRRGYLVCDVTRDAWTGHFRTVDAVTAKGRPIRTAGSWAVAAGRPGLHPA
jgi:alkaline phosphatase D